MAEEQKEPGKFDFLKKIFGKKSEDSSSPEEQTSNNISPEKVEKSSEIENVSDETSAYLQILAENTMSFQQMVKDINISRQNVQKLVVLMGGEKKTAADEEFKTESEKRELVDERKSEIKATQEEDTEQESKVERVTDEDFFKEQDQKEAELESGGEPASLQVPGEDGGGEKKGKKGSLIGKFIKGKLGKFAKGKLGKFAKGKLGKAGKLLDFKKAFSLKSILGAFKKYIVIAAILSVIFMAFKDTIIEWVKGVWNAIIEKLSELWTMLKDWFIEAVQPILKAIGDFVQPLIDAVSSFFSKIMDFVVSYFTFWKDLILSPVETIKKVWDKFMGVLDWYKGLWAEPVKYLMGLKFGGETITKGVKAIGLDKFLGIGKVEPKKDDAKKEKEDKAKKQAAKPAPEPKRVTKPAPQAEDSKKQAEEKAKQQKKSQDKGFIEEVQERQVPKKPEEKKPEPAPAPAPTPTPAPTPEAKPAPSPAPAAKPAPEPKRVTKPAPTVTPSPAPAAKPSTTPSAQESGKTDKAKKKKPGDGMSGMGKQLAMAMAKFGITNQFAQQAIVATAAKESNLNPQAQESGAKDYLGTLRKRGLEYIWKVFPQLKPGGRVAKALGFAQGVPAEYLEKEWSKGNDAFFNSVYGGLGTNAKDGDAFTYRGRGFIGITGRKVYENVGKGLGIDLVQNPDAIMQDFDTAAAAVANYFFIQKGGKEKVLEAMNSFTDFKSALRYVLRSVAGAGHKEEEFEIEGKHLHEQYRKASEYQSLGEEAVGGGGTPSAAPSPAPTPAQTTVAKVEPTPAPAPAAKTTPTTVAKVEETPKPMSVPAPAPTGTQKEQATEPTKTVQSGSLSSLVSVQSGVDMSGINSDFKDRLAAMAADFKEKTGNKLLLTSGFRSNEKQKELYDQWVAGGKKNPAAVAQPMPPLGNGKGSFHVKGLAVDINSKGAGGLNALAGSRDSPTGWLEKFGLTRPVKGEDWHVQPVGLTPTPDNPENPGAPIAVANKDGKAVDVASGKKENVPPPTPEAKSSDSGTQIASASTEVAAGQREQQKPTTPVIINSATVNNNMVQKTKPSPPPPQQDTARAVVSRTA